MNRVLFYLVACALLCRHALGGSLYTADDYVTTSYSNESVGGGNSNQIWEQPSAQYNTSTGAIGNGHLLTAGDHEYFGSNLDGEIEWDTITNYQYFNNTTSKHNITIEQAVEDGFKDDSVLGDFRVNSDMFSRSTRKFRADADDTAASIQCRVKLTELDPDMYDEKANDWVAAQAIVQGTTWLEVTRDVSDHEWVVTEFGFHRDAGADVDHRETLTIMQPIPDTQWDTTAVIKCWLDTDIPTTYDPRDPDPNGPPVKVLRGHPEGKMWFELVWPDDPDYPHSP